MAAHVLVVATVTATSDDLLEALRERARRGSVPVDFTLVMPASGADRAADEQRLEEALTRWREAGLKCDREADSFALCGPRDLAHAGRL